MNVKQLNAYSVVGFLETVWLLDTLIRKLLQNLLDSIIIIFRSIVSGILTKNHVNHKGICTVGIMRRFNCGKNLPGVTEFALKTIRSPHTFGFFM